jgi:hypothetical protein
MQKLPQLEGCESLQQFMALPEIDDGLWSGREGSVCWNSFLCWQPLTKVTQNLKINYQISVESWRWFWGGLWERKGGPNLPKVRWSSHQLPFIPIASWKVSPQIFLWISSNLYKNSESNNKVS